MNRSAARIALPVRLCSFNQLFSYLVRRHLIRMLG
jgi:hypothetical protein